VRYACARIEDARDDPVFDRAATRLEDSLRRQRDMILRLIDASSTGDCGGPT
jgi:hypothetical protein